VANVVLLGLGAVIANVVGTTGASMLLIKPFMRLNEGRLRAIHVVMFIFIISNCGGALTPIGDPPLYLGYLKGVPFFWTAIHLWPMWATCIAALLATFFVMDVLVERQRGAVAPAAGRGYGVRVRGATGIMALALIIGAVFIDPLLAGRVDTGGVPVGPLVQIVVAAGAYFLAPRANLESNEFNFAPVEEVGLLFVGIFATMAPALGYLAAHGASLGIDTPTEFYFATGSLSAVLDNAPTYATFLQIAFGREEMTIETLRVFVASHPGAGLLRAVSLGAVFFGAFTYIGNGPNFMVKAIAERSGVRMPSFFGYFVRAVLFLSPALLLVWAIFIR
jgi:Na+/H+ antiporter NhaD/arsenite permease-like protein